MNDVDISVAATEDSKQALTNFVRMVRAITRAEAHFKHRPSFLEFSWTSACNQRCLMCAHSDGLVTEKAPADKAEAFLEEILPNISLWTPSANSEPLLNDIGTIARLCAKHGVFLILYSNAMLLTPQSFEILAPWIHALTLSVDCHEAEIVERLRPGLRLSRVLPNLTHAVRRTKELGIMCGFNTVLMSETVTRYPAFVDWVADLGETDIRVLGLLNNSSGAGRVDAVRALGVERVNELLRSMIARAEARGINLYLELPPPLVHGEFAFRPHWVRHTTAAEIESPALHPGATNTWFLPPARLVSQG